MAGRRSAWFVAATALAVFASGCIDLSGDDEEKVIADPQERTEHAMKSFSAALSSRDSGDVKRLHGTLEGTFGGEEEGFSLSDPMNFDIEIRWGTGGVVQALLSMKMGGMSFEVTSWCTESQTLMQWGSDIFESRPSQEEDSEALCQGWDEFDSGAEEGIGIFDEERLSDMPDPVITEHDDGTLTAVFTDTEEGMTARVTIDEKGRVSRFGITGDGFSGDFSVEYGARETIAVPDGNARIPATVYTEPEWAPESTVYRVTSAPERPALSEFEARWVETDWEEGTDTELTSFTLTDGKQSSLGVSFEYRDLDGDGTISPGDEYEVWEPASQDFDTYREIQLYDLWADGAVNTSPLPAPGFVPVVLLGVLAAIVLARRR